jgi:hypothetical protein
VSNELWDNLDPHVELTNEQAGFALHLLEGRQEGSTHLRQMLEESLRVFEDETDSLGAAVAPEVDMIGSIAEEREIGPLSFAKLCGWVATHRMEPVHTACGKTSGN